MTARHVTLSSDDWALARKAAHEAGQRGVSAGLRAIIAQYRLLRERELMRQRIVDDEAS